MQSRRTNELQSYATAFWAFCGAALIAFALFRNEALASRTAAEGVPLPCAVVESFSGSVQILDATRTMIIETEPKAGVPCGGWVSTGRGGAVISHRDGARIHLAGGTFAQFPEPNPDGKSSLDGVVLFKGQLYAQAQRGGAELRVITANGRARLGKGAIAVVFSAVNDETQVIAAEGKAFFENRFQPERRVELSAGEASSLNFRQLRTIPSAPRAMAVASLRAKLAELGVAEKVRGIALAKAKERADRTFAAEITVKTAAEAHPVAYPDEADAKPVRSLASEPKVKDSPNKGVYAARTELDPLKRHLVRKLSGEESVGEEILFPNQVRGKPRKFEVEVEDPGAQFDQAIRAQEEKEKRRLIEELSQIKAE